MNPALRLRLLLRRRVLLLVVVAAAAFLAIAGPATTAAAAGSAASGCNSFAPDTPVLMADGTSKPIGQVRKGDKVTATDPRTGKTAARKVTAIIKHTLRHDMVRVGLSDGSHLDATAGHPFWSPKLQQWVQAKDLQPNDRVLTPDKRDLWVTSLVAWTAETTAINLTVAGIHTYYAGTTPVLVHNANACARGFSSGKAPHEATVTVTRADGTEVTQLFRSGQMTPEEKALGFPQSSLATHTEARAVRELELQQGDQMLIAGQYPPCTSCRGAMNRAASDSGAAIRYTWPDGEWVAGVRR